MDEPVRDVHPRAAQHHVEIHAVDANAGVIPEYHRPGQLSTKINPRPHMQPVLRIRIHVFLGLLDPDPDPWVRSMDPNPDPDPSIIKQK